MSLSRRSLLSTSLLAGIGSAVPACFGSLAVESGLRVHTVADNALEPMFSAGDRLLIDITENNFQQAGIYLYPAWGQPSPYLVLEEQVNGASSLGFFHPVTRARLWNNSLASDQQFAGRVISRWSGVQEVLPQLWPSREFVQKAM